MLSPVVELKARSLDEQWNNGRYGNLPGVWMCKHTKAKCTPMPALTTPTGVPTPNPPRDSTCPTLFIPLAPLYPFVPDYSPKLWLLPPGGAPQDIRFTTPRGDLRPMILFGTAVGSRDVYGHVALPSIRAVTETEAAILSVRDAPSIAVAYNQLIQEALSWGDDVEAIALIHDDVEIQDRNFLARVRRGLNGGRIGVLGVIGGRELTSMGWWSGRHLVGRAWDYKGYHGVGPLRGEVDVVDGLLMVVSRQAMERVQFDEKTITGFFGYDSDYCVSVKAAGLRVVVEPFRVYHAAHRRLWARA